MVSYNTAAHLPAALQNLTGQTHPDLRILVVDNNSHDGSAAVAGQFADVEVIANRRNVGYTGAANQALQSVPDGGFFLVTPDVRLESDHIAKLAAALSARPEAASVQGRLHRMHPDGSVVLTDGMPMIDSAGHTAHTNRVFRNRGDGSPDDGSYDSAAEIFGVTGAAALHRVEALADIAIEGEVFDDDLFAFFEDVDLDWRLKARGWESWYVPGALGRHERGGEGARRSQLVERLSYRNWFLTVLKNDDLDSAIRQWHLLAATTALRTADLALTMPVAFAKAVADLVDTRSTRRKRRIAETRRTVDNAAIVERWFEPFDYRAWIAKRIRRGW